jgi:uncharacterized surface protein with fasciclin (FAS1) repeats
MKRLFLKMAGASVAGALISACGGTDSGDDKPPGTMVTVATRGGFSALVLAATKAGLADELSAPTSNLTLLAPTNDAFGLLSNQLGFQSIAAMVDALPASTLESILLYHVLPGTFTGPQLLAGGASQNTSLVQNGATLALALGTANQSLRVTDSIGRVGVVGLTDVPNDNGTFHVIDRVLMPPGLLTVLQTVQSNPERFSQLSAAASAPALVTALNGAGPFTLFAPIDEAFRATDVAALLPTLVPNQTDALLKYHVLGSRVLSADIVGTRDTLAGQPITVNAGSPPVIVDTTATNARITGVDIIASNGVVHIIDKVLLPTLPAPAP